MSEINIKGRWKGKSSNVSTTPSLMIGMVYQSNNYIGVLLSIENDDAVLRIKNGSEVKVKVQSLKILINE